MTDVPEALVEKAAQIIEDPDAPYFVSAGAGKQIARAVLAAVWSDMPDARPVVDREALAEALSLELSRRMDEADCDALADEVADAILASGVVQDAADVRRAVAEEIEAHCRQVAKEFYDFLDSKYADHSATGPINAESILGQSAGWHNAADYAARIAREAGGHA